MRRTSKAQWVYACWFLAFGIGAMFLRSAAHIVLLQYSGLDIGSTGILDLVICGLLAGWLASRVTGKQPHSPTNQK